MALSHCFEQWRQQQQGFPELDQKIADKREEVDALKAKLENYMAKNNYFCVSVQLNDPTTNEPFDNLKYLRVNQRTTERSLTEDAIEDALQQLTQKELDTRMQLARQRAAKKKLAPDSVSLDTVLSDYLHDYLRQNHYTHSNFLTLCDNRQRRGTVHPASDKTTQVVQRYLQAEHQLTALKQRRRKLEQEQQNQQQWQEPLLSFFERQPVETTKVKIEFKNRKGENVPLYLCKKEHYAPVRLRVVDRKACYQTVFSHYPSLAAIKKNYRVVACQILKTCEQLKEQRKLEKQPSVAVTFNKAFKRSAKKQS